MKHVRPNTVATPAAHRERTGKSLSRALVSWGALVVFLALLAGVGFLLRYRLTTTAPTQLSGSSSPAVKLVPPPLRIEQDAQGYRVASCDPSLLGTFLGECGLPSFNEPIPPVEKEQFESFHKSLGALGGARSADNYGRTGMFYFYWRLHGTAAAFFEKAHELAPFEHRWCHYLGFNAALSESFESAERYYKQAIELDPGYFATYLRLARLYSRLDRDADAEPLLLKSIEADSTGRRPAEQGSARHAYAHEELGAIALKRNDLKPAEAHCQEALRWDPRDRRAHGLLAQIYARTGEEEKRRFHARAAAGGTDMTDPVPDPLIAQLRRETNALAVLLQDSLLALEQKQYARMVELCENIVRRDPAPERSMILANAYRLNEQYEFAREVAVELVRQHAERADFHLTLGKVEVAAGNVDDALPSLDAALARDPQLIEAYEWKGKALATRGIALSQKGEVEAGTRSLHDAEALIRSTLERSPSALESQVLLAKVIFLLGKIALPNAKSRASLLEIHARFEEARSAAAAALELQPLDPECAGVMKVIDDELAALDAGLRKQGIPLPSPRAQDGSGNGGAPK